ncbi:MAG: triose-phosphate isomerase [Candidatus Mcinerneyibacterium aminivorans]|uniref:Triosephosphate isomerase n=1 Tax=Candidatus Mcinerneyibacterium aminivorans TaxID=2703815 RepID=A0A5D0MJD2_9BACT|nr:MAG: triose-phosphate isomerase [Candidatus Mcinerneyibacterium aminivorans]
MRKFFIAGNWKMNKGLESAMSLSNKINEYAENESKIDIGVFPPYIYLQGMKNTFKNIIIGSQNIFFKQEGAYTGEISPKMLDSIDVEWTIIGHSERRNIFNESEEWVNKKVKFALNNHMKAIVCIGEKLEERKKGYTLEKISMQVKNLFYEISKEKAKNITLAYEPIWAIGTGETASPEDADEVHEKIREVVSNIYDSDFAEKLRIQYGGSVKPHNAEELLKKDNIDGALIGGASLEADSFLKICDIAKKLQ